MQPTGPRRGDEDVTPCPAPRDSLVARSPSLLLLGACYVTPLWRIQLVAPQYPEGLGHADPASNAIDGR